MKDFELSMIIEFIDSCEKSLKGYVEKIAEKGSEPFFRGEVKGVQIGLDNIKSIKTVVKKYQEAKKERGF